MNCDLLSTLPSPLSAACCLLPAAQVGSQRGVQRLAGSEQGVVAFLPGAAASHLVEVRGQRGQVSRTERPWVAAQVPRQFQPLKPRGAVEGEVELVVVQDVEDHDVVSAAAEQSQAPEKPFPRGRETR